MQTRTALLYSGGLDSAILLDAVSREAGPGGVVPIYVACGSAWEPAELAAARRFIAALGRPAITPLVVLAMPTADLYGDHWSHGRGIVPGDETADEAVYLPGRNALLAVKPLVWCGMHGVERLALATLAGNPFADARQDSLAALSQALSLAMSARLEIVAPFAEMSKTEVMWTGSSAPLHETFSCIDPKPDEPHGTGFVHCGRCNKCAERQRAFAAAALADPTLYAA